MDARPPENEPSLRQGDVLLFHGHGFVSWAIRRFDESDVDRAAIVLRPETMAEATASGLRHVAIQPAVDSSAFTYVRRLTEEVIPSSVAAAGDGVHDRPSPHERSDGAARRSRDDQEAPHQRADAAAPPVRLARSLGRCRGSDTRPPPGAALQLRVRLPLVRTSTRPSGEDSRFVPPRWPKKIRARRSEERVPRSTLLGWASRFADPKHRTVKRPQEPLESLIAAFARVDSPNDPIVPRSYVADAAIAEPAKAVDDAQLHAAAVRFRDALLRLEGLQGGPAEPKSRDRWGHFRTVANVVTPGDLRYSHSLRTVTSLRPSLGSTRTPGERGRASHDSDR